MKRLLKILSVIVLLVFVTILVLPFFFKGKIVDVVKKEINKQLNAKVDFVDADLSLIRQFPDFTLDLNGLSVLGFNQFEGDTLFYAQSIGFRIDFFKAIQGEYVLKEASLYEPVINLLVTKGGLANWDVAKPGDETAANTDESDTTAIKVQVNELNIYNGHIVYADTSLAFNVRLSQLNGRLKGLLSTGLSEISTDFSASELNLSYDGMTYLSQIKTKLNAIFLIDLQNSIYTFKENKLYLNDLALNFDGSVGLGEEDITILLNFKAVDAAFKNLVSLVPAVYYHDFEKLQADGTLTLQGFLKGVYNDKSMPGYGIEVEAKNASLNYPDLPSKIEDINLSLAVSSTTGQPDDTKIDLKKLGFTLAKNPFEVKLLLTTPVSDPNFQVEAKGKIDLSSIESALPIDQSTKLSGLLSADLKLNGKMSDIDAERFSLVTAAGSIIMNDFVHQAADAFPVEVEHVQINFSPSFIDLIHLKMNLGKSDFAADGRVDDYLGYLLADRELDARLKLQSIYIDVNELLKQFMSAEEQSVNNSDTSAFRVELPKKIKFSMMANADSLDYDTYHLSNVVAKLLYQDQKLVFDPLSAALLDGNIQLAGFFEGTNADKPSFGLIFNIENFDIPSAYQQIGMMQKAAPVAEKTTGRFSTQFTMNGTLDASLNPDYPSLTGSGKLLTSKIQVESINSLQKLADLLGNDKYKRIVSDGLNFSFEFLNGRVFQKPFNLQLGEANSVIGGSIGFDQTLDYDMLVSLPYQMLGKNVQSGIEQLANTAAGKGIKLDPGTSVQVKAKIGGNVLNPQVTIDYKNFAGNLKNELEQKAMQEIQKQKEDLQKKAREEATKMLVEANAKSDTIMAKARRSAAQIKAEGQKAANLIRQEAAKQAENLIAEGKKKGMLGEIAAKEAAKKIRSEAESKALLVEKEANQKADRLVGEAQKQADKILEDARKKADEI